MRQLPDEIKARLVKLIADKRIIDAGYRTLVWQAFSGPLPAHQARDLRAFFFAGAAHLYAAMMTTLDEGDEPTDPDMARLAAIDDELQAFFENYMAEAFPAAGRA